MKEHYVNWKYCANLLFNINLMDLERLIILSLKIIKSTKLMKILTKLNFKIKTLNEGNLFFKNLNLFIFMFNCLNFLILKKN